MIAKLDSRERHTFEENKKKSLNTPERITPSLSSRVFTANHTDA